MRAYKFTRSAIITITFSLLSQKFSLTRIKFAIITLKNKNKIHDQKCPIAKILVKFSYSKD
ncbi:hypothetical protein CFS9_10770 [Flavobacterium sp. CFS9]|uniref:Uncharacterized protein n=1 Tax=Flavobacterium sp. CFS9 TaxID=3143118 RepID=A0AAT9GYX4_9FLAO